jgi:predicted ester cyclase
MKLTAEDYQRRFSEMSDEEFLAIDRQDLVDLARRCYDAELARRQLEPPEAALPVEPAESQAEGEPPDDWATVAVFTYPDEAGAAEGLLKSADIPTFLANRHTAGANWNWTNAIGGLRLMVPGAELEAARDLLHPYITEANKKLVEQWFQDVWMNEHPDPAAAAAHLDEIRAAVPGFTLAVEDMLSEVDRVAARISIHGKHSGKNVDFEGICILRLDAGMIAESWIQLDWSSFREQAGE